MKDKDSRPYRFPYLIGSGEFFPEDFPAFPEGTRFPALFLPRDDPDWFGRSVNPPRVVLMTKDTLEVHFHPESGRESVSFPLDEDLSIQRGRMLLIGWIEFTSKQAELTLHYNRRIDEPVGIFLGMLRAGILDPQAKGSGDLICLGGSLSLKFENELHDEIDRGEAERVRLFMAPQARRTGPRLFRGNRWTPGDLLTLTDRRLLWITERYRGARALHGAITCYAHPHNLAQIAAAESCLSVSLRNGKMWRTCIPEELAADARKFATVVEDCLAIGGRVSENL